MNKTKRIKLDTQEHFPEPEVFAATVEKYALDARNEGFGSLEVTFFDPLRGWTVMDINLRRGSP